MASAVFSGSCTSRGGGAFEVLIAQNLHPRVQVSPMSWQKREVKGVSCFWRTGGSIASGRAHHDGRGRVSLVASPALSDVGASRLLADRVELQAPQVLLDLVVAGRGRDLGLEVARQAGPGAIESAVSLQIYGKNLWTGSYVRLVLGKDDA